MSVPRVVVQVQVSKLDDSVCFLRSPIFGAKKLKNSQKCFDA